MQSGAARAARTAAIWDRQRSDVSAQLYLRLRRVAKQARQWLAIAHAIDKRSARRGNARALDDAQLARRANQAAIESERSVPGEGRPSCANAAQSEAGERYPTALATSAKVARGRVTNAAAVRRR